MLGEIRLADRRGLLSGRGISRVQSAALEVLAIREAFDKADAVVRTLIPQEGPQDIPPGVDYAEATEADLASEEDTTWVMGDMSGADAMSVLASMGLGGTMTVDDLD